MTRKTDGEKIDELERFVAALFERMDNVRKELEQLEKSIDKMIDPAGFAVVEDRLNELKKKAEETGTRRWSFLSSLLGAVIGAVLAILGQLLLAYLKR